MNPATAAPPPLRTFRRLICGGIVHLLAIGTKPRPESAPQARCCRSPVLARSTPGASDFLKRADECRTRRGSIAAERAVRLRRSVGNEQLLVVSEVEPHDGTADRWSDDLGKAGGGENAQGADVELFVDDIGPRHRIALDRPGAALAGEVDGGFD